MLFSQAHALFSYAVIGFLIAKRKRQQSLNWNYEEDDDVLCIMLSQCCTPGTSSVEKNMCNHAADVLCAASHSLPPPETCTTHLNPELQWLQKLATHNTTGKQPGCCPARPSVPMNLDINVVSSTAVNLAKFAWSSPALSLSSSELYIHSKPDANPR